MRRHQTYLERPARKPETCHRSGTAQPRQRPAAAATATPQKIDSEEFSCHPTRSEAVASGTPIANCAPRQHRTRSLCRSGTARPGASRSERANERQRHRTGNLCGARRPRNMLRHWLWLITAAGRCGGDCGHGRPGLAGLPPARLWRSPRRPGDAGTRPDVGRHLRLHQRDARALPPRQLSFDQGADRFGFHGLEPHPGRLHRHPVSGEDRRPLFPRRRARELFGRHPGHRIVALRHGPDHFDGQQDRPHHQRARLPDRGGKRM